MTVKKDNPARSRDKDPIKQLRGSVTQLRTDWRYLSDRVDKLFEDPTVPELDDVVEKVNNRVDRLEGEAADKAARMGQAEKKINELLGHRDLIRQLLNDSVKLFERLSKVEAAIAVRGHDGQNVTTSAPQVLWQDKVQSAPLVANSMIAPAVWEDAIRQSAKRGNQVVARIGAYVGYLHRDSASSTPGWYGIVIPRPNGARRYSADGTPLVYIVRDNDFAVRGCLPENLILRAPAPTVAEGG